MKTNHLIKFNNLPFREKLLFTEALLTQYTVWLVLKIIPFKWIPGLFPNPGKKLENPGEEILWRVKTATSRANLLAFWKNKCLVQALAARLMLRRRGITTTLHLGVKHDDEKKMIAHAWLKAGEVEVVDNAGIFTELFSF